jgi:hypothetical protein
MADPKESHEARAPTILGSVGFANSLTGLVAQSVLEDRAGKDRRREMVRGRGFEPLTPTVSR